MKEAAKEVHEIHERLEPVEGIDRTSQLETLYTQSPLLLRGEDSDLEPYPYRFPSVTKRSGLSHSPPIRQGIGYIVSTHFPSTMLRI